MTSHMFHSPATPNESIITILCGDQARAKSQPEIQTTARKNLGMLCKRAELDTHRITNSAHNTGTHCDLTAGSHTLSAQREDAADARNADTRNAGATGIKVPERAAHWPRRFSVLCLWPASGQSAPGRAVVSTAAMSGSENPMIWPIRLYESESEADDDLHELMETQGELAASAQGA